MDAKMCAFDDIVSIDRVAQCGTGWLPLGLFSLRSCQKMYKVNTRQNLCVTYLLRMRLLNQCHFDVLFGARFHLLELAQVSLLFRLVGET